MRSNQLTYVLTRRAVLAVGVAVSGAVLLTQAQPLHAGVPTYNEFELQARSNLCVNTGGADVFNLPCDAFFNSSTPAINNGQVAVQLGVLPNSEADGVWFGADGAGEIVFTSESGASVSDVSLNNNGKAVFEIFFASQNGIFFYDSNTDASGLETTLPIGASQWDSPVINDSGEIGYRAAFGFTGDAYVSYNGMDSTTVHITDNGVKPSSPYSFLFTPDFNADRNIAGKVREGDNPNDFDGENPDQIRIFDTDGSSILMAEDNDSNSKSAYGGFDNSLALNDNGAVAFVTTLTDGTRAVVRADSPTEHVVIASENDPDIDEIIFFPPDLNNNGLVVFRAFDGDGLDAIFVGDGENLVRLIGRGDELMIDLGLAQINQHDDSPAFGGAVSINDAGDVVFNAGLTPAEDTQIEWGSGIIVAGAETDDVLGDLNGDGNVGVEDLLQLLSQWGNTDVPADLDGSGTVGVNDLLILLGNWSA